MKITSGNRLVEILDETHLPTVGKFKLKIIKGYPNSVAGIVYMPSVASIDSYGRVTTGQFWSEYEEAVVQGIALQTKANNER